MKAKWIVLGALAAGVAMAPAVMASEGGHEAGEAAEEMTAPDSLAGLWHEIKEHQEELHKVISDGKLDDVHRVAFAIRDLASELPKYSANLSADSAGKLATWLAGIVNSAEKLDGYGDAGDKVGTEKEAKRMNILLGSIEKLYPAQTEPATAYTCSMHPEVVQAGPGKCPKCGMALVPQQKAEHPNHD
jgi:hypothetical protein